MTITITGMMRVLFNSVFKEANQTKARYRIMKGSAGSGKSTNVAMDYIIKLTDPKYAGANLLCIRKTEETNRQSTFAELQHACWRLFGKYTPRIWKIRSNPLGMKCKITGNEIIFRGAKDNLQREKIKSITFDTGKLTWIWCEEATELLQDDLDILDDRLRGDLTLVNPNLYYQITCTFNPVSAAHWLKKRFFDAKPSPDVFLHHSTYLDNRFIDPAYHRRMQRRKIEDPDGYQVYALGEWGELGGTILTRYETNVFQTDPKNFDYYFYGQDFGFNHANAILGVGFKENEIYICFEIYVYEHTTDEVIAIAEKKGLDKDYEMWCDSAEPDRIKVWQHAGFRAKGVDKRGRAGSVLAQIDWLQKHYIHIHPSCVHTLKEISQWKWRKDATTGEYTDAPVDFMDDAMAALRYSVERLRRGENVKFLA